MKAILFREVQAFFSSLTGYLVIGLFLILNGLFLWVFEGEFNILNSGYADMAPFFALAPWIFIFLIPAVTMKSFAEERKQGTLELLFTKPISLKELIAGKFLGALTLIIIAILPSLIYVLKISDLGMPFGNIDMGSVIGSYIGLLFLIAAYTSIGIFTSCMTDNQIVAFMLAVLLCFVFYFGFQGISNISNIPSLWIEKLGMEFHFKSMSRGVLDTRDILYFISITCLFLSATQLKLKSLR